MKNQPVLENHYGTDVWTNKYMDELRRTECLCLNCKYIGCQTSRTLYEFCKENDLALAVTRCPGWEDRQ